MRGVTGPGGTLAGLGDGTPKMMGRGQLENRPHNVLYNLLSVFVPPLAVAFKSGDACETLINIGLTILGYFPGLVHAMVVVNSDARLNVCT